MASGMEMLLKSMGFDPSKFTEEAQKLIGQVNNAFNQLAGELRTHRAILERIEARQLGQEPDSSAAPLNITGHVTNGSGDHV